MCLAVYSIDNNVLVISLILLGRIGSHSHDVIYIGSDVINRVTINYFYRVNFCADTVTKLTDGNSFLSVLIQFNFENSLK